MRPTELLHGIEMLTGCRQRYIQRVTLTDVFDLSYVIRFGLIVDLIIRFQS